VTRHSNGTPNNNEDVFSWLYSRVLLPADSRFV